MDDDLDTEPIDIKIEPDVVTKINNSSDNVNEQLLLNHSTPPIHSEEIPKQEDEQYPKRDDDQEEDDYKPELTEPVNHKCNDCDEFFSSISDLSRHKSNIHGKKQKKFQCTGKKKSQYKVRNFLVHTYEYQKDGS